ncbi:MAG: MBL fold metallo-hydrolase [Candidatus Hodarchaeota archaeon]
MVKMKFYGHSAFKLVGKKNIVFDPGIFKGRILVPQEEKVDVICITHRHKDHFGNAAALAKKHKALIVGNKQTIGFAYRKGVPSKLLRHLQDGKTLVLDGIRIAGYRLKHGFAFMRFIVKVMGFVLNMEGVTFAHLGDTVWCYNLREIKTDVLFIPIGGIVSFNIEKAVEVVKVINPSIVVPIHTETSISSTDFRLFQQLMKKKARGIDVEAMKIGETIDLKDNVRKK